MRGNIQTRMQVMYVAYLCLHSRAVSIFVLQMSQRTLGRCQQAASIAAAGTVLTASAHMQAASSGDLIVCAVG